METMAVEGEAMLFNQRAEGSYLLLAINHIADDRMADSGQVNANLMCPSGFWLRLKHGIARNSFNNSQPGDGLSPIRCDLPVRIDFRHPANGQAHFE